MNETRSITSIIDIRIGPSRQSPASRHYAAPIHTTQCQRMSGSIACQILSTPPSALGSRLVFHSQVIWLSQLDHIMAPKSKAAAKAAAQRAAAKKKAPSADPPKADDAAPLAAASPPQRRRSQEDIAAGLHAFEFVSAMWASAVL